MCLCLCAVWVAGCGSSGSSADTSASASSSSSTAGGDGKALFVAKCGACHTLAAAQTTGTVGPNLDQLKPNKETVLAQIAAGGGAMPAGLYTGQDAETVAAYVASVAGS